LESHDQKEEALIHHEIESSWIASHLTVIEMIGEILGVMVVDKKGILRRTA